MAPEIRSHVDNGIDDQAQCDLEKADSYSFGMTVLSLYEREFSLDLNTEDKKEELQSRICEVNYGWLRYLLDSMLRFDPEERITIRNAKKQYSSILDEELIRIRESEERERAHPLPPHNPHNVDRTNLSRYDLSPLRTMMAHPLMVM